MQTNQPITEIIRRRYSCRTYQETPVDPITLQNLADFSAACQQGPLGSKTRFAVLAASEQERSALKGLGTYGFIKSPTGFLVGAVQPARSDLEDFGFLMEKIILHATRLELGTCWLGGFFTRSTFAKKFGLLPAEQMPAVTAFGYPSANRSLRDRLIRGSASRVGARQEQPSLSGVSVFASPLPHSPLPPPPTPRLPWETLFFDSSFAVPLSAQAAGAYRLPLENTRLAPSASNKQPWRILRQGCTWHFYMQRTPGYPPPAGKRAGIADMQRIDLGIAMCHFQLSVDELGLPGSWIIQDPAIAPPNDLTEYVVSYQQTHS